MFCDLVGSTAISEAMDAEDYRELVAAYQVDAVAAIDRFGGHLGQYLGDGILVYFGYPEAHEDDAERAVRSGGAIVAAIRQRNDEHEERFGVRLSVRIGIHTGPVVVSEMGGSGHRETQVLGATMNIAARLESVAEPDSVVVSDATLRLLRGSFVTRDVGTPALKGVQEEIRVHAIVSEVASRTRFRPDASRLTPLVGRDRDLEQILSRWAHAREGQGQGVLISGEAGLGKSRLLHAFRERLDAIPHRWFESQSTIYTQESSFFPLVDLIERGLGLREAEADDRLARLEIALTTAGLDLADAVPLIGGLLGIPFSDRYPPRQEGPELIRKKTIDALVSWVTSAADERPLVLLVEDLHWCDASTLEFVGLLLERVAAARVLVLLTARPEFHPAWTDRPHIATLEIARLDDVHARSLVASMNPAAELPQQVTAAIVERADGVPLFLEELTKTVLESDPDAAGASEAALAVPSTLRDSLMARLDRLRHGKRVAQVAAVIGRQTERDLLEAVADFDADTLQQGLRELLDAELVFQRGVAPDVTYVFKHAMVQDAAYESLLRSARRSLHARAARLLEARTSEPEVIARHYDEAGMADEAIRHYRRAGEQATQRVANEEAFAHLSRALALAATLPESESRDRLELELQLAIAAPLTGTKGHWALETQAVYERARDLAAKLRDGEVLPRVLAGMAWSSQIRGELAKAIELATEALAEAERADDSMMRIHAHAILGSSHLVTAEFQRAWEHLEAAIKLYDPAIHAASAHALAIDRGVYARAYGSWVLLALGLPARALAMSEESVELGRRVNHPYSTTIALVFKGMLHCWRGELAEARAYADETMEIGERLGFPGSNGLAGSLRGWVRALTGDVDGGIEELEQVLATMEAIRFGNGVPTRQSQLAEALLRAERWNDALAAVDKGLEWCERTGQRVSATRLRVNRGQALLGLDPSAVREAEAEFRTGVEFGERSGTPWWTLNAAVEIAGLWVRQQRTREARELLAPLYAGFTEGHDTQLLRDARHLLEELPSS